MYDPRVHVGVAAIIQKDYRLLMIQRGRNASHGAGQWSVPGGWVDYGEDPRDTVIREVIEETGCYVLPYSVELTDVVANTYPDAVGHVLCIFFEADVYGDTPPINMEPEKAERVEWVDAHKIRTLDLFPPLAIYLERKRL